MSLLGEVAPLIAPLLGEQALFRLTSSSKELRALHNMPLDLLQEPGSNRTAAPLRYKTFRAPETSTYHRTRKIAPLICGRFLADNPKNRSRLAVHDFAY
jgi:hypothetical protein